MKERRKKLEAYTLQCIVFQVLSIYVVTDENLETKQSKELVDGTPTKVSFDDDMGSMSTSRKTSSSNSITTNKDFKIAHKHHQRYQLVELPNITYSQ